MTKPNGWQTRGHGNTTLTAAAVREIRQDPRRLREVAADHSVSPQTISKVRHGKAWAHVPEDFDAPPVAYPDHRRQGLCWACRRRLAGRAEPLRLA